MKRVKMAGIALLVLSVILSNVPTVSTACPNCADELCISDTIQHCLYGCNPGYWGGRCANLCTDKGCPANKECYRNPVHIGDQDRYDCVLCPDGNYRGETLASFTDCSAKCPENCETCSASNECHKCTPSFYNQGEVRNCSTRCPDKCAACLSQSLCTDCKPPYYIAGKVTDCSLYTCPDNCKECIVERCLSCDDEYFDTQCLECQVGHFGEYCNKSCSANCLNGCNMKTGDCNDCVINTYGQFCDNNCSTGCADTETGTTLCNSSTGSCLHGCKVGFYKEKCENVCNGTCKNGCTKDTGICNLCEPNTHGLFCENNCSLGCLNNSFSDSICNRSTGKCSSGCASGYFTDYCNKTCSENCVSENSSQTKCNETDGTCLHGCKEGHYGVHCEDNCSENCAGKVCNRTSGECIHGCQGPFQGMMCKEALPLREDDTNLGQAIGSGVAVGVICLALLTGVVILLVKRRKKTKLDKTALVAHFSSDVADTHSETVEQDYDDDSSETLRGSSTAVSIEEPPQYEHIEETEYVNTELQPYANATLKTRVSSLYNYSVKHYFDFFEGEFKRLPKDLVKPYTCAKKKENAKKSRYTGIYPYDDSRVKIKEDPDFFINACYIDGYKQEKAYIASLGPTKRATENFSSFWKMVWHEQSDIIVMLTNLREATGTKCEQYWPDVGESLPYGDVTVACHSEEACAEHVVRVFTAIKKKTKRTVTQLHFTAWPDQGVPDSVVSLVEFWQRVRASQRLTEGPVIVHCSAGIGRTGTYIALDRLTLEGKAEGSVNVYGCVSDMRQQRVNMVQTVEQYIYLHKALAYTLTFQSQEIMIDSIKDSQTLQKADVQPLFQELSKELGDETKEDIEARVRNKSYTNKNRKGADIPGDRHRPRLYLSRTSADLDYVNAVYVNSYRYKDNFVVAQTPLPSTVEDFLCLTYQEDCSCIVSLDDVTTQAKNVGKYLPTDDHQVTAGQFIVSATESHSSRHYNKSQVILTTKMKNQPKKTITLYQYTGWKQEKPTPESNSDFIEFVTTVKGEAEKLSAGRSSPILIHCMNGAERSGLFCVVAVLSERVQYEGRVCLSNTVRQIRNRRKTAVPNKHQLQFCHQCIAAFMDVNCMYTNIAAAQNQNQ